MPAYVITKEQMESLDKRLSSIEGTISHIPAIEVSLSRILKALDGNGQPGLIKEIAIMGTRIEKNETDLIEAIANRKETTNALASQIVEIRSSIKEFFDAINDKINELMVNGCKLGQLEGHRNPETRTRATDETTQILPEIFVSWKEIREKLFWPIAVSFILSIFGILALLVVLLSQHQMWP
jgi:hypothetical protein